MGLLCHGRYLQQMSRKALLPHESLLVAGSVDTWYPFSPIGSGGLPVCTIVSHGFLTLIGPMLALVMLGQWSGGGGVERNLFVRSPHCCFVTIV
jgi:hypothetical protein